jgi:hypothetical protein
MSFTWSPTVNVRLAKLLKDLSRDVEYGLEVSAAGKQTRTIKGISLPTLCSLPSSGSRISESQTAPDRLPRF